MGDDSGKVKTLKTMKAKVIIENGHTKVILTPENAFDTDVIQKVHTKKEDYNLATTTRADYRYGTYENHQIIMEILEIRP